MPLRRISASRRLSLGSDRVKPQNALCGHSVLALGILRQSMFLKATGGTMYSDARARSPGASQGRDGMGAPQNGAERIFGQNTPGEIGGACP
jgi:hypothetical protein